MTNVTLAYLNQIADKFDLDPENTMVDIVTYTTYDKTMYDVRLCDDERFFTITCEYVPDRDEVHSILGFMLPII